MINGDVVFHADMLKLLLKQDNKDKVYLLTSKKDGYDEDDMKVEMFQDKILQVNKKVETERIHAESIGIVKFSEGSVAKLIRIADDMINNKKMLRAWFLAAIEAMIGEGAAVHSVDASGYPWAEIDYPKDLDEARSMIVERIKNYRSINV